MIRFALAFAALSICFQTFAMDVQSSQMLSVMPFPGSQKALVGWADESTNQATFAVCRLQGPTVQACDEAAPSFPLTKMADVQAEFEKNLEGPNAYDQGVQAGTLRALGVSPELLAVFFGVQALRERHISDSVRAGYARLFNVDTNSPRFVSFDSAGGQLSPDQVFAALSAAILAVR